MLSIVLIEGWRVLCISAWWEKRGSQDEWRGIRICGALAFVDFSLNEPSEQNPASATRVNLFLRVFSKETDGC